MMAVKNINVKKKKKSWYGLYAPESLNNAFLGETTVYNPSEMIGKTVNMHLSMITNDMKKQNIIVSFIVKEVKDNKGLTDVTGYNLSNAYIKRLVRRKRDKIDDSFLAKSKDDKVLRIKTVVMTNSQTHESATSAIRLSLRAKIKKALKEQNFVDFINSLMNSRLQKDWKSSLNKIYPLKFLEVRHVSLEESKTSINEEIDLTEIKSEDEETTELEDTEIENVEVEDIEEPIKNEADNENVEEIETNNESESKNKNIKRKKASSKK